MQTFAVPGKLSDLSVLSLGLLVVICSPANPCLLLMSWPDAGTIWLSLLSGAIYGSFRGFVLTTGVHSTQSTAYQRLHSHAFFQHSTQWFIGWWYSRQDAALDQLRVWLAAVNTVGSLSCYLMSFLVGKPLVHAIWPERLAEYGKEVQQRKSELLNYIIFLRVTPIFPNVFINVASPIVEVPVLQFSLGELRLFLSPTHHS